MGKQKPTFARQTPRAIQGLPKIPSGIAGLDEILAGGFPEGREIARRLQVLKSRGSKHSNRYHQYAITDEGIQIKAMPGVRSAGNAQSRPLGAGRTTRTASQRK